MADFLSQFLFQCERSSPLFLLIAVGYLMARYLKYDRQAANVLAKFAFNFALPAMLFRILANQTHDGAGADARLLIAFFGSCFILFVIGKLFARHVLRISPVGSVIYGTGTVFCNNGLLGLPLAIAMLGESVLPSISMVISFNALILWTLAFIAVEFARRTGALNWKNFGAAIKAVFKNPLIISIFLGVGYSFIGAPIPYLIDEPLRLVGNSATAIALIVVGMGLAEYGFRKGLKAGICLSLTKLLVFPLLVFGLASFIDLGETETLAVVFLASLPMGVNVYLMCKQFKAIEDVVATAMVLSTVASAITVPLSVTVLHHFLPNIHLLHG